MPRFSISLTPKPLFKKQNVKFSSGNPTFNLNQKIFIDDIQFITYNDTKIAKREDTKLILESPFSYFSTIKLKHLIEIIEINELSETYDFAKLSQFPDLKILIIKTKLKKIDFSSLRFSFIIDYSEFLEKSENSKIQNREEKNFLIIKLQHY
jgi:hypothetical protein